MSALLGLSAYDDSPAEEAIAPDPPPPSKPTGLLSIVDYTEAEGEDAKPPTDEEAAARRNAVGGVSIDDVAVARAAPRMLGSGVQVSIVKRTPPRVGSGSELAKTPELGNAEPGAAGAAAAAGTPAIEPSDMEGEEEEASRVAFDIPPSPPGAVAAKVMDKYAGYVAAHDQGRFVNDLIRYSKRFRNPDLLEKFVTLLEVDEYGSNYPTDLYDPKAFGKEEYYEQLERARQQYEERQSRKPGERVEFRSTGAGGSDASAGVAATGGLANRAGGVGSAPAAATAAPTAGGGGGATAAPDAPPPKRKSKWDSAGEPAAQRPRN